MPLDLADIADLELYREGDDETLLEQAQALVRDYCGWHISPEREDDEITVDGFTCGKVLLPTKYVTDVSEVTVDGAVLSVDSYEWHEGGWIDMLTRYSSPRKVVVTLTHGYPTPPLPVTRAVLELVEAAKSRTPGVTSIRRGPFAETYGEAFSPVTLTALGPYALPGFA